MTPIEEARALMERLKELTPKLTEEERLRLKPPWCQKCGDPLDQFEQCWCDYRTPS